MPVAFEDDLVGFAVGPDKCLAASFVGNRVTRPDQFAAVRAQNGAQRRLIGRRQYTTITGRYRPKPIALGKWRYPALILVALVAAVITVAPMSFVLIGTFMSLFGFFHIQNAWTLHNWTRVFDDPIALPIIGAEVAIPPGKAVRFKPGKELQTLQ